MIENAKLIKEIEKSMKIEGCNLTEQDILLMTSFLNNEITEQQGIEKIKKEFLSFGDFNV